MIQEPFLTRGTSWLKNPVMLVGVSGMGLNLINLILSFEWLNILGETSDRGCS